MRSKRIICTVTNDLSYDQRMTRICSSLSARYEVTLVGRRLRESIPLESRPYRQKRIRCLFRKGKFFYFEYNLRLLFFLLFSRADLVCAVDLDTIVPCYLASRLKGMRRVYDAHELFCEMKEVVTRPRVYRAWKKVEGFCVPRFRNGYTVSAPIAGEFEKLYGVRYELIRNVPLLRPLEVPDKTEKFVLYQGAVNEGRSFETLIPAFREAPAKLLIAGTGNFFRQAQDLVDRNQLNEKIKFLGPMLPGELAELTRKAWVGITLFENRGLSNYYSLANRFFDYLHAGVPQICVNYPAYREINQQFEVALLIDDLNAATVSQALRLLLGNEELHSRLQKNCLRARQEFNWQKEESRLLQFYERVLT
ncbi:MAG TPA: glycosyltransferase [Chitinophagaceae bacterium]|nr:glycosyltransferase [Chitinophagaceae bacterium]